MPAPRAVASRPRTFVSESTALGARLSLRETIPPKPRPPPQSDAPERPPRSLLRRRLVPLGDHVPGVCPPRTARFPAARAAGARISVASRLPASLFYAVSCPLPGVMRSPRVTQGPRPLLLTREPLEFLLLPREFIPCSLLSPFRLLLLPRESRGYRAPTPLSLPLVFPSMFCDRPNPLLSHPFLRVMWGLPCPNLRFHQGVAGRVTIWLGWSW